MQSHLVNITSKIKALARSGQIEYARKVFDEMVLRDVVAWNSMLSSYSQLGLHQEALSLFQSLRTGVVRPDHFTFTSTLSACASSCELKYGHKIHALVIVSGYNAYLSVNNSLIDMYGKCFSHFDANKVFEEMEVTNEVSSLSWCSLLFAYVNVNKLDVAANFFNAMPKKGVIAFNTMIAGHARQGEAKLSVGLFKDMLDELCTPDQWTLSALMNACAESRQKFLGFMVHGYILKSGWSSASEANNSILSFYATVNCHNDVLKMVHSIDVLNQVSWNAIIDAHMKVGNIDEAFTVFTQSPEKNLVSWTSMIAGFARNGHGEHAIYFFVDMTRNDIKPDEFTFGAVLHACSTLAVLGHGKMIHACGFKSGLFTHTYVGNGLVNMYAKCGEIRDSQAAFCDIYLKDLISWNTMLFSYGLHGWSKQVVQLLEEMLTCGVNPDKVTFIGLFMSCSHSGLVDNARALFESMSSVYGISPGIDHVTCLVDILGRSGHIEEARKIASEYFGKQNTMLLQEVLFGACSAQNNIELGKELGKLFKSLDPQNEMSYILLSNLYCASGQWKEAEMVRQAMVSEGVKKMPGFSWIEVDNQMTIFAAGREPNPWMGKLDEMISILDSEMRFPHYFSRLDGIT
nr:pentatricopeptide repeat-containing protein At2g36980, mitochondrial [Ipomoea batatas]GMD68345.1 pentatricopeptide repeat-containing protein At2g36980, mitochondrial [Ipomoea batatas]